MLRSFYAYCGVSAAYLRRSCSAFRRTGPQPCSAFAACCDVPMGAFVPEVSTGQAAARLGVSPDTVRRKVQRGELVGRTDPRGRLWVTLPEPAPAAAPAAVDEVTHLQALLAEVRTQREALLAQIERADVERAELRRMLNLEQQTLAALRLVAAPAEPPAAHPEAIEKATSAAEPPASPQADLAQALKQAGVKKQQRRKLLERLAAVWRR
jgi:hypothetical protein